MDDDIKIWLYDIAQAIDRIESFFGNQPKRYADYIKDYKTKYAVERNIEIIGEAMNRILKQNATIQITNARKIVDARNQISHGYDRISDETVWGIVINHLPILKCEVANFLNPVEPRL